MNLTNQAKPEPELRRAISKTGYSALTLNSVIGAGIFGLPAVAVAKTGAFSPWLFVIAGLLIFSVVLSFALADSLNRSIAMLLGLWLITCASAEAWLTTLVFMGLGALLYALSRRPAAQSG